jgi:lipopolysaccharide export system permease protein
MNLLGRYIFRQAGGALSLILMSLGGIVWIALALKQLDVVTSQGQDALTLLKMTTLALPNLLAVIAPFALLIATLHTLNRLGGDSELIIVSASGGAIWVIARPFILLAVLVALAVAYVNHVAQPWSLQQLKAYIVQARTDLLQQVIQPGRFSSPEANLTFHIRERSATGELYGLLIHDTRNPKEIRSYLAEKGVIAKQEDAAYLIMTDGHILNRPSADDPTQIVVFDQYIVNLDGFEKKTAEVQFLKPRERYLSELMNPKDHKDVLFRIKGQLRSEIHERFSNPIYPIAFVLVALAAVGQSQSTRQNRTERLVMAFLLAVGIRIGGFAVNNLATLKAGFVPVLYAVPLLTIAVALVLMVRGARPKAAISITDMFMDRFGPLLARLSRRSGAVGSPAGGA